MNPETTCPDCRRPLPANAPGGLCPECLMRGGLGTHAEIDPATTAQNAPCQNQRFVPPPVGKIASAFPQLEVLEVIGQGGMGAVYRARQKQLDRVVALKILPPDIGNDAAFADRFAREAKAMAKLSHPGIVTIHDFGQAAGLFYFVMEFVDGLNLGDLSRKCQVSPKEALQIVPQICDALQYAHDQGIVHRDIKPENILLDRQGNVKVADFGLAKLMGGVEEVTGEQGAASGPSVLSSADKVLGTPQYMAPEQMESPLEVDHRADVYSLGVVFYQLLTGDLPHRPIEPPSRRVQVDVRLDEIVLRALEDNPDRRYQHVSVLKTRVETIAKTPPRESPGRGSRFVQSESFAKTASRLPWQIWIVVACLVVEGILGNLPAIPQNPVAATWVAAKSLFVFGLVYRWRWIFVLFLLETALHAFAFSTTTPLVASMNLVLFVLTASAWRSYFPNVPHSRRDPAAASLTEEQASSASGTLIPVLIGGVVFVLWLALSVDWSSAVTSVVEPASQRKTTATLAPGYASPIGESPQSSPSANPAAELKLENPGMEEGDGDPLANVGDIPCQDLKVADNDRMRYFLIGPKANGDPPEKGHKLVVALPGGDGGADFSPFVRRILKNALDNEYLVAQPVAFKWRPAQQIVWPTRVNSVEGQEFATEDFVEAVVRDVQDRHMIDGRHVFALSWSSGGPAGYAISLAEDTPISGSYVAMSVFNPDYLPPLENAQGHAYFIDHSPADQLCPLHMANEAEQLLKEHGASVRFNTYEGGHGWRGDVYGRIRGGIEWLEGVAAVDE